MHCRVDRPLSGLAAGCLLLFKLGLKCLFELLDCLLFMLTILLNYLLEFFAYSYDFTGVLGEE